MSKRIIVIQVGNSILVQRDKLLLDEMNIKTLQVTAPRSKGMKFVFNQCWVSLKLIWFLPKSHFIYILFADYHAVIPILLSKLFKVKSLLFIGGYDASCLPHLNYGVCSNPMREYLSNWSIRNANWVLPKHKSLQNKLIKRVGKIKGKWIIIPNGYDSTKWYCDSKKTDMIVTVSSFSDEKRMKIKGLDFFIELARHMPNYKFMIIGATQKGRKLLKDLPDNLKVLSKMDPKDIRNELSRCKVYAQFSLTEGMPNALCEAMLCECISVGTDVGAISDLLKDVGYVIPEQNLERAQEAVEKAIKSNSQLGRASREKIRANYHTQRRKSMLLKILSD